MTNVVDWTKQGALAVLQTTGDGPFGQSDVDGAIAFLNAAEAVRQNLISSAEEKAPSCPIPNEIGALLERTDWTPEEALHFYAAGKHFDVANGHTRILDTGAIASNALKHHSLEHLELKGDAELHELRAEIARLRAGTAAATDETWTAQPPLQQGWYWHWNGDPDCSPIPTSVLYSGTEQKCFVSAGQLGLAHAVFCDEYGGLWRRMVEPSVFGLPEVESQTMEAIRAIQRMGKRS